MKILIYRTIAGELHYLSLSVGLWGIYFKRYLSTGVFYIQTEWPIGYPTKGQRYWYSNRNPYMERNK